MKRLWDKYLNYFRKKVVFSGDLKLDIRKYEKIAFSVYPPKKEWFKTLHYFMMENSFKSPDEVGTFFKENGINEKEVELYYNDFMSFHRNCNSLYGDLQFSELKKLAIA